MTKLGDVCISGLVLKAFHFFGGVNDGRRADFSRSTSWRGSKPSSQPVPIRILIPPSSSSIDCDALDVL
jgi:hypothetical protein